MLNQEQKSVIKDAEVAAASATSYSSVHPSSFAALVAQVSDDDDIYDSGVKDEMKKSPRMIPSMPMDNGGEIRKSTWSLQVHGLPLYPPALHAAALYALARSGYETEFYPEKISILAVRPGSLNATAIDALATAPTPSIVAATAASVESVKSNVQESKLLPAHISQRIHIPLQKQLKKALSLNKVMW